MRGSLFLVCILLAGGTYAAAKPHVVSFGKWQSVKWFVGATQEKALDLKVRPLYIDGKLKEYSVGQTHDVTERLFVVRRAFRRNDALPEDTPSAPRWRWERGGWLLVDRGTGHISQLGPPDFDNFYALASWYRDYVVYCGISEDGKKLYAVVAQLGRRKPVIRKFLGDATGGDAPDSACPAPRWQRQPARVTFEPRVAQELMFTIRERTLDPVNDLEEEENTE